MAEINLSDREARRYSRKTRWFLQRGIDYFDHYRRGALRHWRDHERQPIYTQFPIPFAAPAVPDPAVADENPTITARPDRPFRDIRRRDDTAGGRTVPDDLRRLIESVNFRMVKVLGAGSQGLAVLFESTTDGSKVVFKWSNEVFETAREMWCMRQLVGARHIVQRMYPPGVPDFNLSNLLPDVYMHRCLAQDAPDGELEDMIGGPQMLIYVMEFMEHGNFNKLARRASEAAVYLKDSELWRVFLCFFRSCVALAYPGRWDRGLDPQQQMVPTQEEFVPLVGGQPLSTVNGLIDFDMNDRNVMVGEDRSVLAPYEHDHDRVPIFKVGDLGYVGAFMGNYRTDVLAHAQWRVSGNPTCNSPEQFTAAWNNISDSESWAQDDTAGKFDWWTNLWQIGRLMTILLTQHQALVPPDCIWHEVTIGDGSKKRIPTYANPLVNDEAMQVYDPLLVDTLAWCMAHRPGDRPTIFELEQRIVTAVARDWSQEDETDRISIRQLLSMPPPPAQPS